MPPHSRAPFGVCGSIAKNGPRMAQAIAAAVDKKKPRRDAGLFSCFDPLVGICKADVIYENADLAC